MSVVVESCADVDALEVRRLLAIELRAEPAPNAGVEEGRAASAIAIRCERDETVEIKVVDALTSKSLARTIGLEGIARAARARFLALAATELVTASWLELATPAAPATTAAAAAHAGEARAIVAERLAVAEPPRASQAVVAVGRMRFHPSLPQWLFGGGVAFVHERERAGASIELLAEWGSRDVPVGVLDTVSAGVAAQAFRTFRRGSWSARTGAGARGGLARVVGRSEDPEVLTGDVLAPWVGPAAQASLVTRVRKVELSFGFETGYALAFAVGRTQAGDAGGIRGMWLGVGLSGGILP